MVEASDYELVAWIHLGVLWTMVYQWQGVVGLFSSIVMTVVVLGFVLCVGGVATAMNRKVT